MPAANYSGENFLQEVEFYQHDIKQGQWIQKSVLFESHFNKNFTCTGLLSLRKLPSCSKSVFYIPQAYTQTPVVAVFHVLQLQSSNPRGENIVWMEDKDLLEKSDNDTPQGSFPGFSKLIQNFQNKVK